MISQRMRNCFALRSNDRRTFFPSSAPTYASLGLPSRPLRKTPHVTGRFCGDYQYHHSRDKDCLGFHGGTDAFPWGAGHGTLR